MFFDIEGLVHYKFVPCDQAVNLEFYREVLRRSSETEFVLTKWKNSWLLNQDNVSCHTWWLLICEHLVKKASCDFDSSLYWNPYWKATVSIASNRTKTSHARHRQAGITKLRLKVDFDGRRKTVKVTGADFKDDKNLLYACNWIIKSGFSLRR